MEVQLERVVWSPPTHAVIAGRDVLVQVWETATPPAAFRAIIQWCRRRAQREPVRPLFMMSIVAETAPMPDAETRALASELPEFFTEFVLVVEGSGLRASSVRAVLAGMALAARRRATPVVVADVEVGCVALARRSAGVIDAVRLQAEIQSTREKLRGA